MFTKTDHILCITKERFEAIIQTAMEAAMKMSKYDNMPNGITRYAKERIMYAETFSETLKEELIQELKQPSM